jgi:hypothetical protein
MGDAHGDGWNQAESHVDAYTGRNQYTYVTEASWMDGSGTVLAGSTTVQQATHQLGCLKDGCYAMHFNNIGRFPAEVYILGSDGNEHNQIVGLGNLTSTRDKFMFKVLAGSTSMASEAMCDELPFVQLDGMATLAPGATHAPGVQDSHTHVNRAASHGRDATTHDYTARPTPYPTPASHEQYNGKMQQGANLAGNKADYHTSN